MGQDFPCPISRIITVYLILKQFMELNFINNRSIRRDKPLRPFRAKGELVREVEAVNASGIHQLERLNKAGEHRIADDMDNRFTIAVGLVNGLVTEEIETAVVELDALRILRLGAFTGFKNLVVKRIVPHRTALDIGIALLKIGKINSLQTVDITGDLLRFMLHNGRVPHVCKLCDSAGHIVGEEILPPPFEGVHKGFNQKFLVESRIKILSLERQGEILSVTPRKRIFDGSDLGSGSAGSVDTEGGSVPAGGAGNEH